MGWTEQGFNAQGFNPSLGIKSDYWYVECSGDEENDVEEFYERLIDLGDWNDKIKIVYGTSQAEYFRGYLLTDRIEKSKSILKEFNNFAVYQSKYGGVKKFRFKDITLLPFLGILLFFETNAKNFMGELIPLKDLVNDLLSELEFGIYHGFIDSYGKSWDVIKKELKTKIMITKKLITIV
jgi:hypothetical protein